MRYDSLGKRANNKYPGILSIAIVEELIQNSLQPPD